MALVTGKGLTAFAQGLYDGYTTGKKRELEQAKIELELEKAKREKQMQEERSAVGELKPTKAFSLVTPDGIETVYTDEKEANEAAQALSGLGEGQTIQVQPRYLVAGQRFDNEEAARKVAERESSPAAIARRRAAVASRYGFNDVAASDLQTYRDLTKAIKYEKVDALMQARADGDLDTLAQMYSAQTGQQVRVDRNQDGTVTPVFIRDGQDIKGDPIPTDTLWDYVIGQANSSPDTLHEDRTWKLNVDKFRYQQGQDAIANSQRAAGLGIQAANVDLRRQELQLNNDMRMNPAHTTQMGYDAQGQIVPITRGMSYDPKAKTWNTTVTPGAALPGVYGRDPTARPADPFAGLGLGLGGGNAAPSTVFDGLDPKASQGLLELNNARNAPNQGGSTPTPIPGGGLRYPDGSVTGTITR